MKHLNANYNATTLGPLFDSCSVNKTPKVQTVANRQVTYSVVGHHPTLKRSDFRVGIKSFNEAVEYSGQLTRDGFECVTIKEDYSNLTGKELKEKGLELVRENNENWMEACIIEATKFAHYKGAYDEDFTGEDIRFDCERWIGTPSHPNAFGALINTLIKRKIIVPTGEHRQMKDRKSHARSTPVYRAS